MNASSAGVTAATLVVVASVVSFTPASSTAANADTASFLKDLSQRLQSIQRARFSFRTKKYLHTLNRPLQLEGFMTFAREHGLHRHVTEPLEQEQLITPDGNLIERQPDGSLRRRSLDDSPAGTFFTGLYGLFAGNLSALNAAGRVSLEGNRAGWTLQFVPDSSQPRVRLPTLRIQGHHALVQRLVVVRDAGDSTVTELSPISTNEPLPDEVLGRIQVLTAGD